MKNVSFRFQHLRLACCATKEEEEEEEKTKQPFPNKVSIFSIRCVAEETRTYYESFETLYIMYRAKKRPAHSHHQA